MMIRLSVNLNKVALLRNSRHTGVPNVLSFAQIVYSAGAHGITAHPRPDERHIRANDINELAALIAPWRPAFEFNIEGRPDERFLELVKPITPEQCTLVPDQPAAFTSEKGWEFTTEEIVLLRSVIEELHGIGSRVIVFVDPDPAVASSVPETGADGIEIYTGSYSAAFRTGDYNAQLAACAEAARVAGNLGLRVNAGHDLNLFNLPPFVEAVPNLAEVSIGHELTADALTMGFEAAIKSYKKALARGSA
jgi:pyridoxine 5-phosphate synthase